MNQAIDIYEYNLHREINDRSVLCHAPFKNLRFETMGIIKVCCYSQYFILGQYPKNSLHEIWFGKKAQDFRQAMSKSAINNYGCDLCVNQVKNREYTNAKPKQFDNLTSSQEGYPVILDFALHNTCNLECVMCQGMSSSSIRKNRDRLPPLPMTYDERFIDEIHPFIHNASQFVFAGGEPFLIEIYFKIWELIAQKQKRVTVDIVTNGTIMSSKVKRILDLMPVNISVSIESLEEKNYSLIRKNASLTETLSNIETFYQYCNEKGSSFSLSICPMQINWREVPEMVRFANERNIALYIHTVNSPASLALWNLKSEELLRIADYYESIALSRITPPQQRNYSAFSDLTAQIRFWAKKAANSQPIFQNNDETYTPALSIVQALQERFINEDFKREALILTEVSSKISEMNLHLPVRAVHEMLGTDTSTLATMVISRTPDVIVEDLMRMNKSF